jgi:hypothetical protein
VAVGQERLQGEDGCSWVLRPRSRQVETGQDKARRLALARGRDNGSRPMGFAGENKRHSTFRVFNPSLPPWRNICAPRFYVLSCYYIKKFMKKLIKNIIEYFISSSIKF